MSQSERNNIIRIREKYLEKEKTKYEILKKLDKKVKRFPLILSCIIGSLGTLIFGAGMCLCMPEIVEGYIWLGVAVGIIGALVITVNYPLYKSCLSARRRKYRNEILNLSREILNEN